MHSPSHNAETPESFSQTPQNEAILFLARTLQALSPPAAHVTFSSLFFRRTRPMLHSSQNRPKLSKSAFANIFS